MISLITKLPKARSALEEKGFPNTLLATTFVDRSKTQPAKLHFAVVTSAMSKSSICVHFVRNFGLILLHSIVNVTRSSYKSTNFTLHLPLRVARWLLRAHHIEPNIGTNKLLQILGSGEAVLPPDSELRVSHEKRNIGRTMCP